MTGRATVARSADRCRRLVASLAVLLLLALLPAPARAHAHLQRSAPSAGARLTVAPTEIRLTFSEAPELAVSSVRLAGPGGVAVPLGALAAAPGASGAVAVAIRGPLAAGAYTVTWQVVAADGHPSRGQFAFTLVPDARGAAPAVAVPRPPAGGGPGAPPAVTRDDAPSRGEAQGDGVQASTPHEVPKALPHETGFGVESPLYAAIRWLQDVGLVVALGAVAFRYAVLGSLARVRAGTADQPAAGWLPTLRTGAARLGLGATLAVAVAAVLRFVAQAYALNGPSGAGPVLRGGLLGAMLLHTLWGTGWLLQVAGVLVAAAGFAAARRPRETGWGLATFGAAALAVSPALSGHAASAPHWTALVVVADAAHVVGAGGWLGSLLVVVAVGVPAARRLGADARGPALAELVHAFSPTALLFAGVVVVTGVFATWVHVGSVPALWQTAYGRTLLVKLALFAAVAAAGAYNWRRVRPALGTAPSAATGAARLRRSATVELVVGLLVLAATAVLVATPTAVDVRATATYQNTGRGY